MMNHNRKPVWPEDTPLPAVDPKVDPNMITQTRLYKLITPLFGGGVEPQKADPITVVRASEVRGHLRFWWRATRGGQFNGNLEEMRKAEEAIWGSAAGKDRNGREKPGPSSVSISVHVVQQGKPFQAEDRHGNPLKNIGHVNSKDGYAAFPMRDSDDPKVVEKVEFELTLSYPLTPLDVRYEHIKLKDEIEEALWAWEIFGGIGARTRRGFGSLQCTHINGTRLPERTSNQLWQDIETRLKMFSQRTWHNSIPHLSSTTSNYRIIGSGDPVAVWRQLIGKLRSFRQARPGFHRSFWPEPDEIRRRTGTHKLGHAPSHPVRKFPRAAFGLPIIFEFKRGDVPPEPQKTTLQGAKHDRLASPLILRPIACANGQAVGLAAVLEAPIKPPGGWLLKDAPGSPTHPPIEARLTSTSDANAIKPLKDVGGETNVLLAFLKSL
ncbi:MAG: type III-B CRISPR module RAMP protein Cmr1 [Anaerolineae bacterium]